MTILLFAASLRWLNSIPLQVQVFFFCINGTYVSLNLFFFHLPTADLHLCLSIGFRLLSRANQQVRCLALRDVTRVRLFRSRDYTGKHSVPDLLVFPTLQPSLNKPHPYSRIRCQCGIVCPCLISSNTFDLGSDSRETRSSLRSRIYIYIYGIVVVRKS